MIGMANKWTMRNKHSYRLTLFVNLQQVHQGPGFVKASKVNSIGAFGPNKVLQVLNIEFVI